MEAMADQKGNQVEFDLYLLTQQQSMFSIKRGTAHDPRTALKIGFQLSPSA